MHRTAAFLIAVALAVPAAAQDMKNIRDWSVGCDNLRTCTALGLPTEDGAGAYVKITRDGEGAAEPEVTFVIYAEGAKPGATLSLAFDPADVGGLPAEPLPAKAEDDFLRASLTGAAARAFIAAAQKGKGLTVTATGPGAPTGDDAASGAISLAGATGAFLYVDDAQKRLGTTTALKDIGDKEPASAPAVPAEPVVAATKMAQLGDLPPLPKVLAKKPGADDGCDGDQAPIAIRLSSSLTIWEICGSEGAYNVSYDFSIVEKGVARPVLFELPAGLGETSATLTNPSVSEDGLTLSQFDKGRGIGDCGVDASWAFDGKSFRLVQYAAMDNCMGVYPDDWPVLYRARVE